MKGAEQQVQRICELDLQDDLEMIANTTEQHQRSEPENVPGPPDESLTGMKHNIPWNFHLT